MNRYEPDQAVRVACALAPYGLRWFEDVCDPLDLAAHARIAEPGIGFETRSDLFALFRSLL